MVARMTGDRQTYAKVGDDWVPVIHVLNLQEGDTVELAQMRTKGVYQKVGDDWVPVATLIGADGNPVDTSSLSPPLFWETYDSRTLSTTGTVAATTLYLTLIESISALTETMSHYHTTATGNFKESIWTFDGTTFTKRAETASTALAGSSVVQDTALAVAYERLPDIRHYAGFIVDTSGTFLRAGATAAVVNGKGQKGFQVAVGSLTVPATYALGDLSASVLTMWQHGE